MEKLQFALEKARSDRATALGAPAQGPRSLPAEGGAGEIPLLPASISTLARARIVTAHARGPAVEAFRMLRTQVMRRLATLNGRAIAVTSPRAGEGKSFVAANLAIAIAQLVERSALLVDADLRNPSVARLFGVEPAGELSELLLGQRPLEACLVRTDVEELLLLPQKSAMRRSSELLSSQAMTALAQELRRRFPDRVIIYDCPPLLAADDPVVLQRLVDGVLLVVQEGRTTRADLERAAQLIGEERYLGSVLNNARQERPVVYA